MGAYGLGAATAFAVAVALPVSVSSTPTAEAADAPLANADNSATAAPGDTVQITVTGEFARVSITETSGGAGASFDHNDGQEERGLANEPRAVASLARRLLHGAPVPVVPCYEAGPTGLALLPTL